MVSVDLFSRWPSIRRRTTAPEPQRPAGLPERDVQRSTTLDNSLGARKARKADPNRVADLLSQWECLRTQLGRFAKKNSCRADEINTLDVRLAFRVFEMAGYGVQIVADGLNLLDPKSAALDRALYLVDASRTLVTDPATGDVTVPLIVNPSFGRPAHFLSSGRFIRVGVKVGS